MLTYVIYQHDVDFYHDDKLKGCIRGWITNMPQKQIVVDVFVEGFYGVGMLFYSKSIHSFTSTLVKVKQVLLMF